MMKRCDKKAEKNDKNDKMLKRYDKSDKYGVKNIGYIRLFKE